MDDGKKSENESDFNYLMNNNYPLLLYRDFFAVQKTLHYRTTVRIMLQNKRKLNCCVVAAMYWSANVVAEGNAAELSSTTSASTTALYCCVRKEIQMTRGIQSRKFC